MSDEATELLKQILERLKANASPTYSVRSSQARQMLQVGKTKFQDLVNSGMIRRTAVKLGKESTVLMEDVNKLLRTPEGLPTSKKTKFDRLTSQPVAFNPSAQAELLKKLRAQRKSGSSG